MEDFVAGDVRAFRTLYDRYDRPLYGFCLRMLADEDAAVDAFQEVFLRVIAARDSYEPRGRFRSWLFTIARRICIDRLRADRDHVSLEEASPVQRAAESSSAGSIEARDALARLLAGLPEEQREVILLHRLYGFSYAEIADIWGSTEAAVKQRAYRGLKALRRIRRSAEKVERDA